MGHYDCPDCGRYMCISECEEAKQNDARREKRIAAKEEAAKKKEKASPTPRRKISKNQLWELSSEFMWRYPDGSLGHCGLCGNSGVIDTLGRATTAAGLHVGVRRYCICPNGRWILKARGGKQVDENEARVGTPTSAVASVGRAR